MWKHLVREFSRTFEWMRVIMNEFRADSSIKDSVDFVSNTNVLVITFGKAQVTYKKRNESLLHNFYIFQINQPRKEYSHHQYTTRFGGSSYQV